MARGRLLLVVVTAILVSGCAAVTREMSDTSAGRVTALEGEAVVLRTGTTRAQSLGLDSRVFAKDVVQTRDSSRARISLADQTVLTLGERSEVEIREFAFSQRDRVRQMVLKVGFGIIRLALSLVFPPSGALSLLTGLASLAFSGTEVIVEATPTTTAVASLEGTVRVEALQAGAPGVVTLRPGEGTDIALGQPPTPARTWGAARLARVKAATALPE
jgi:ferric-dicitrate binding protein FerR (iron transport regulator)